MERRQKDIITMAEQADLAAVRTEKRLGRQWITCSAENGVEREFSISLSARGDPRGDLNELGKMRRFARENKAAASSQPEPTPTQTTPKKTLTMPKQAAVTALSPVNFYRVCEWVKEQDLANFPNMEALALGAAKHVGAEVPEDEMKLAMATTGRKEPEHWSEPTDPHAILARELGRMMKELGVKKSPAFERLFATLLPGHTA